MQGDKLRDVVCRPVFLHFNNTLFSSKQKGVSLPSNFIH
uniref:Uncharacterized protein n=1 Tax=virus sp. ct1Hk25 TaxID=2825803 RepID=A0A8S5RNU7_9VIRU|nr:MAG TPA: hypothetical protein [virus sp. ct1Hk25]DAV77854.1 MAG TPA: hypothetical protein [Bacteriophage sp.]DAW84283.1 MAG TPA: hypothetical protein [Bacteriophage sp.]